MYRCKLLILLIFAVAAVFACQSPGKKEFVIAESKSYAASLFRQNCAICHGPEADGKTLSDGTAVPSLRHGEFKFKSEQEVYNQIADGGHGMAPFRNQLSEREIRLMVDLVRNDLRGQQ